jgi:cell division protein FtsW (lipid II flippase)
MKTPANVIAKSVEMGGVGFIQGFAMLPSAIKDVQSGDMQKADYAIRKIVSAGLGFTFAYILASMFEPEDFIGAYPTNEKERQLMNEKGAMPNSVN